MRDEYDFSKMKAVKNPYVNRDDTAYLMSNEANREHLMKSIEQYENGKRKEHDLIENK